MTAEKTSKGSFYQENTRPTRAVGTTKALDASAGHTFSRIRPLLPGFITPTASLCVSKERCGPVGGGKPAKLAGACFPRQPVKPHRRIEHRYTRRDRAAAREKRLPLDASRG